MQQERCLAPFYRAYMNSRDTPSQVRGANRRLAAILCADIVNYSRLMGRDEEGTHTRLKQHLREVVEPTVTEHDGQIVKTMGDGFLALFDSPVEAVRCAIVIQQQMVMRNLTLPQQQWLQYRMGINLGDVIVEPDDIFGDGVNIAARLQSLAEPGGVYVSGGVYEQIKNKLVCGYQSLGDERLKNITDPVRIYRVLPDPAAVTRATRKKRFSWIEAALLMAFIAVVGGGTWFLLHSSNSPLLHEPHSTAIPQPPQPLPERRAAAQPAPQMGLAPVEAGPAPQTGPAPVEAAPAPLKVPDQVTVVTPQTPPRVQTANSREVFRDCEQCPEMVILPGGTFMMGSNEHPTEKPVHQVVISAFALGRFPVTVGQWKQCVAAKRCNYRPTGDDDMPVSNVSWDDAQQYVAWLSTVAQKEYRLPREAEWEYAARAETTTRYWWGNQLTVGMANCKGCGEPYDPNKPMKIGSLAPNPFGLYDMSGGIAQWVSDCWHENYQGAPRTSLSWDMPNCRERVLRGGSWKNDPNYVRPASRDRYDTDVRYFTHGLRVARSR